MDSSSVDLSRNEVTQLGSSLSLKLVDYKST